MQRSEKEYPDTLLIAVQILATFISALLPAAHHGAVTQTSPSSLSSLAPDPSADLIHTV